MIRWQEIGLNVNALIEDFSGYYHVLNIELNFIKL